GGVVVGGVRSDDQPSAALVDPAADVDQEVVADVRPAPAVHVEVLDAPDRLGRGAFGVVHDELAALRPAHRAARSGCPGAPSRPADAVHGPPPGGRCGGRAYGCPALRDAERRNPHVLYALSPAWACARAASPSPSRRAGSARTRWAEPQQAVPMPATTNVPAYGRAGGRDHEGPGCPGGRRPNPRPGGGSHRPSYRASRYPSGRSARGPARDGPPRRPPGRRRAAAGPVRAPRPRPPARPASPGRGPARGGT